MKDKIRNKEGWSKESCHIHHQTKLDVHKQQKSDETKRWNGC